MTTPMGPLVTVTPLYHFSSHSAEISIGKGVRISKYDGSVSFDQVLSRHLQVHEPDFLLWYDPLRLGEMAEADFLGLYKKGVEGFQELTLQLTHGVLGFFLCLRLFKPGRLRAGETFIIRRGKNEELWNCLSSYRASLMVVDYGALGIPSKSYNLEADEIPFFVAFAESVIPLLDSLDTYPALTQALFLYSADNGESLDAVGSVTALEALLTKKEENEGLTYRLALRIANLLGSDANSRKDIFKQVKDFYNLRSKIVHGVTLDTKLRGRLNALDSLREMVRRVILSAMALYSEGTPPANLPDIMDELALDDESRKRVCATASKFLHLSPQFSSSTERSDTTAVGFTNKNGQVVVRNTGKPGTDSAQVLDLLMVFFRFPVACSGLRSFVILHLLPGQWDCQGLPSAGGDSGSFVQ
jgi:hypothetical protein